MRTLTRSALALALIAGVLSTSGAILAQDNNMAHVHMGHVLTSWKDTPDHQGLLPTAIAEARIAEKHAAFAASKPDNLAWMKTHTRHVLNAVDPSVEAKGPGLGYGVKKAAAGVAQHIGFAAASKDASKNVKLHAVHVETCAKNTVKRVDEIVALGKQVLAANSAAQAAPLVKRIHVLTRQLMDGVDANGDGTITWQEGGLAEANKHMQFMKKGEGMS